VTPAAARSGPWELAAVSFHERVKASCWDSLAGQLLMLHQPWIHEGLPVCQGCDRDRAEQGSSDPVWPCRTYTVLAATMLGITDVEGELTSRLNLVTRRARRA
jgi:hypothetical protein